mmetsp:Transcript_1563/g.2369  ORF Transcript_1563/g.2369 Transcript_1563/m.2369 type:complete len:206 (+) Transcript_1563:2031-2648(+)
MSLLRLVRSRRPLPHKEGRQFEQLVWSVQKRSMNISKHCMNNEHIFWDTHNSFNCSNSFRKAASEFSLVCWNSFGSKSPLSTLCRSATTLFNFFSSRVICTAGSAVDGAFTGFGGLTFAGILGEGSLEGELRVNVTGPSLTSDTCIIAPNSPSPTFPLLCSFFTQSTKVAYNSRALSGPMAFWKFGFLALSNSPYSVNCDTNNTS